MRHFSRGRKYRLVRGNYVLAKANSSQIRCVVESRKSMRAHFKNYTGAKKMYTNKGFLFTRLLYCLQCNCISFGAKNKNPAF